MPLGTEIHRLIGLPCLPWDQALASTMRTLTRARSVSEAPTTLMSYRLQVIYFATSRALVQVLGVGTTRSICIRGHGSDCRETKDEVFTMCSTCFKPCCHAEPTEHRVFLSRGRLMQCAWGSTPSMAHGKPKLHEFHHAQRIAKRGPRASQLD